MSVIKREEQDFPRKIKDCLPKVESLYYEGDLTLLETKSVAVVGSRRCTQYGRTVARSVGARAAETGVTLVSGLARGIDTEGHRGVLEAGGKTIAVLGGATNYFYPAENRQLQLEIAEKGLLLSLHPPGYRPQPYDFPVRNQIISAVSESVAVIEAGRESGALITAEIAGEMGKAVYAVPGNITSHYSFGSNQLIRDGVSPLIFIDDIFSDMGVPLHAGEEVIESLGEDEKKVYNIIKNSGQTTLDEIYHKINMNLSEISGIITILEIKGIIFSSLGKICVAKF